MAIKLTKNDRVSLQKKDGGLQVIKLGVGWDPVKSGAASGGLFGFFKSAPAASSEDIDLDASIVTFDNGGKIHQTVYFGNLRAYGNAISHSGDNRTGAGDGDDETITVDLKNIPAEVQRLCLMVSSYRGQTFETIDGATCNIRDGNGTLLAEYNMSGGSKKSGLIIGDVIRTAAGWEFVAIGEYRNGRTAHDLVR